MLSPEACLESPPPLPFPRAELKAGEERFEAQLATSQELKSEVSRLRKELTLVAENHSERARTVATAESRSRDGRARGRKEARRGVGAGGSVPPSPGGFSALGFAEGSAMVDSR